MVSLLISKLNKHHRTAVFLPPADTILLTDAASCKSTEVKSVFILIELEINYNSFREEAPSAIAGFRAGPLNRCNWNLKLDYRPLFWEMSLHLPY